MAAGTVTFDETTHTSCKKVIASWTAGTDADAGTVSATATGVYDGQVIGLTTIPAGGGDAPDDNYDVTVTDIDSHDVLIGAGKDRDTANTEHVASASLAGVAGSKLTVNITNAGAGKKGTVILYIR